MEHNDLLMRAHRNLEDAGGLVDFRNRIAILEKQLAAAQTPDLKKDIRLVISYYRGFIR